MIQRQEGRKRGMSGKCVGLASGEAGSEGLVCCSSEEEHIAVFMLTRQSGSIQCELYNEA